MEETTEQLYPQSTLSQTRLSKKTPHQQQRELPQRNTQKTQREKQSEENHPPLQNTDVVRVGQIVHDLKNRISPILMFSELIEMSQTSTGDKNSMQAVRAATVQVDQTIQNYLMTVRSLYQNQADQTISSTGSLLFSGQTADLLIGVKDYTTSVSASLQQLVFSTSYRGEGNQYIATIKELIVHIQTILKEIETTIQHKEQQQKEIIELNGFLKESASLLQLYKTRYPYVNLIIQESRQPLYIEVHREKLLDAIYNLIINAAYAVRYTGEPITLSLNKTINRNNEPIDIKEYIRIAVADQGPGMNDETKKHLFQPFTTTKKSHEGTGLGLVSVNQFIKESGGFIEVESEIGKGTMIALNLPQAYLND